MTAVRLFAALGLTWLALALGVNWLLALVVLLVVDELIARSVSTFNRLVHIWRTR